MIYHKIKIFTRSRNLLELKISSREHAHNTSATLLHLLWFGVKDFAVVISSSSCFLQNLCGVLRI